MPSSKTHLPNARVIETDAMLAEKYWEKAVGPGQPGLSDLLGRPQLSHCLNENVTGETHATMMPSSPGRHHEEKNDPCRARGTDEAIRDRYAAAAGKDNRRILEEFIAATGYHEKSDIRALNAPTAPKRRDTRQRTSLYDEAARAALIVLREASDRVCGKRLKALLPILLPALERNGYLKLDEEIRPKILSMSAATIDRLLRLPKSTTRNKKPARAVPEPRPRIKMRTFADWHEPPPGSMEMDLVAHCG